MLLFGFRLPVVLYVSVNIRNSLTRTATWTKAHHSILAAATIKQHHPEIQRVEKHFTAGIQSAISLLFYK